MLPNFNSAVELETIVIIIIVTLSSCVVATLVSLCLVRSRLPRSYHYCNGCARDLGVWPIPSDVVARPWVEIVSNNNNNNMLPESATFQRLGLKSSKVGNPDLEVRHLESRSLSPVDLKDSEKHKQEDDTDDVNEHEQTTKLVEEPKNVIKDRHNTMKKVLSPASAEVLARKDSVRSKQLVSSRLSRRTLQFQSPIDMTEDDVHNDSSRLSLPRQEQRKEKMENYRHHLSRRSQVSGTSQFEDDPGSGRSAETVIKTNRFAVNSRDVSEGNVIRGDNPNYRNVVSFDNPGYDSVSDHSRVHANSDRESVISPPRRCSVIPPPAPAASRVSVISPPSSHKAPTHLGYKAISS